MLLDCVNAQLCSLCRVLVLLVAAVVLVVVQLQVSDHRARWAPAGDNMTTQAVLLLVHLVLLFLFFLFLFFLIHFDLFFLLFQSLPSGYQCSGTTQNLQPYFSLKDISKCSCDAFPRFAPTPSPNSNSSSGPHIKPLHILVPRSPSRVPPFIRRPLLLFK